MILSQVRFNALHPDTYRLLGDPYGLHIRLCACCGAKRADASLLYRLEDELQLLVQTDCQPDWSKLDIAPAAIQGSPETKPYEPDFAMGARLAFRLRCRPSKKTADPSAKNSRRRYLRTDDERLAWLARCGEKAGFALESVVAREIRWRDTKPGHATAGDTSLPAVQFDGVLVVTDPDKLREAVRKGIGPQKAYGFGLLSLAPLRE